MWIYTNRHHVQYIHINYKWLDKPIENFDDLALFMQICIFKCKKYIDERKSMYLTPANRYHLVSKSHFIVSEYHLRSGDFEILRVLKNNNID